MTLVLQTQRSAQFVVKISKYCNLRCSYCYEFADLGTKARMPLDLIRALFQNIAPYVTRKQYAEIEFVWHGGEPLLIPLEYYDEISRLQKEIFTDGVRVANGLQTNLTVLTNRHLSYLKDRKFFSGLGVSVDPYGDQRVDKRGGQTTPTVLANMQRLRDAEIPFGAIVVVARNTIAHMHDICRFFDKLGISTRFLPFYLTTIDEVISSEQINSHAVSFDELIYAFNVIIDEWFRSSNAPNWDPLDEYTDYAIAHITGKPVYRYDRFETESVFVVNLDGRVWGAGDTYLSEAAYGNLFTDDFEAILNSASRRLVAARAQERREKYCAPCPYYGACPGFFVGDASADQERLLESGGCPVRVIVERILRKFTESGLEGMFSGARAQAQVRAET